MGKLETGGLFSGSLEVVIRTDGRHWNPLMATRLVPRSNSDPVSLRNVVSMVAVSRFHGEPAESPVYDTFNFLFSPALFSLSLCLFDIRVHFQSQIYWLQSNNETRT